MSALVSIVCLKDDTFHSHSQSYVELTYYLVESEPLSRLEIPRLWRVSLSTCAKHTSPNNYPCLLVSSLDFLYCYKIPKHFRPEPKWLPWSFCGLNCATFSESPLPNTGPGGGGLSEECFPIAIPHKAGKFHLWPTLPFITHFLPLLCFLIVCLEQLSEMQEAIFISATS
jgi:hypothetical protein